MDEKEKQRLRDEIAYWSNHQELDKFNYNQAQVFFLGGVAILLGIFNLKRGIIMNILILLTLLIILISTYYRLGKTDIHFSIRDKMIEERYCKIYNIGKKEFKKNLNEHFNNDYQRLERKLKLRILLFTLIFLEILCCICYLLLKFPSLNSLL